MTGDLMVRIRIWGYPASRRRVRVDPDGTIRVWDSVAGHYTLRHGLSARQQARIRRLAAAA